MPTRLVSRLCWPESRSFMSATARICGHPRLFFGNLPKPAARSRSSISGVNRLQGFDQLLMAATRLSVVNGSANASRGLSVDPRVRESLLGSGDKCAPVLLHELMQHRAGMASPRRAKRVLRE